jgi:aspartyl aminopeptidase
MQLPPCSMTSSTSALTKDFIRFLRESPSPFHAVHQCRLRLQKHGFQELKERDQWQIKQGGRYYFTRNQSSIIAFAVGGRFKPGNGVSIVAAHTDSPCLKASTNCTHSALLTKSSGETSITS